MVLSQSMLGFGITAKAWDRRRGAGIGR